MSEAKAVRTLVVWCPDWPITAAGCTPAEPAAVFHANRVVACSEAAREQRVGLWLPGADGKVAATEPDAPVAPVATPVSLSAVG